MQCFVKFGTRIKLGYAQSVLKMNHTNTNHALTQRVLFKAVLDGEEQFAKLGRVRHGVRRVVVGVGGGLVRRRGQSSANLQVVILIAMVVVRLKLGIP